MNKLQNQNSIEAGTEILIPFKCEEQLVGWRVIDKGEYRLITSEKIEKTEKKAEKKEQYTKKILKKLLKNQILPQEQRK